MPINDGYLPQQYLVFRVDNLNKSRFQFSPGLYDIYMTDDYQFKEGYLLQKSQLE